jgi:hypothetical protein
MSINDIVAVSVVANTATPSAPGFGVPLFAASKVPAAFTNRVRTYGSTAAMTTDGWLVSDPAYIWASSVFAQNPRVPNVKIGRRALPPTQTIKLKCLSATTGDVYSITLVTPGGVSTIITYTVPGASTTTTVATALAALIAAVSGFATTASAVDTITIASPATPTLNRFRLWSRINLYLTDATANPGIATDLAAILVEDPNWYGLSIDSQSKAEIAAAAVWTEANKKLFVVQSSEADVADSTETTLNIASVVKAAAYRYTGVVYGGKDTMGYSGGALQGNRFAGTPTPGNETWSYKTLAGVLADNLNATEYATILAKNATTYQQVANINVTEGTKVGSGEHIDIVRGVDWLSSNCQVRTYALFVNSSKVPYTQKGAALVGGAVQSALNDAEKSLLLTPGSSQVQVPDVSTIDSITKGNRLLPNLAATGQLAGAIETASISVTVTL